jgi:hypothetical protein
VTICAVCQVHIFTLKLSFVNQITISQRKKKYCRPDGQGLNISVFDVVVAREFATTCSSGEKSARAPQGYFTFLATISCSLLVCAAREKWLFCQHIPVIRTAGFSASNAVFPCMLGNMIKGTVRRNLRGSHGMNREI